MFSTTTWLTAFPKSGSTWLRFLLQHLVHGPPACSRDVDRGMPSIHGEGNSSWKAAVEQGGIILSHRSYRSHVESLPPVESFIQMVRHPADVVLSDAHFFALTQLDRKLAAQGGQGNPAQLMQDLSDKYINNIMHFGKVPKQDRLGFGNWSENVGGWLDQRAQRPHILLRYEDLKTQPIEQLERLCHFLGMVRSSDELEAARQEASVESMKQMQEREIREKIPGRFYDPRHQVAYGMGLRFVRKAEVGQKLLLQGAAAEKLVEHFGSVMELLGYTLNEGAGAAGPLSEDLQLIRPIGA
jgi:hypothetical protein